MGNRISIDKHLSSVSDILNVKPSYFKKKIRFDSNIPLNITHHVKIWKYFKGEEESIQSQPISLQNLLNNYQFLKNLPSVNKNAIYSYLYSSTEWIITRRNQDFRIQCENLSPRGLSSPITFGKQQNNEQFFFKIYVWNGLSSNQNLKTTSYCQGLKLEELLNKGGDPFLEIMFSGGVFRNRKLQKGTIIQLNTSSKKLGIKKDLQFLEMKKKIGLFQDVFKSESDKMDNCAFNKYFLVDNICDETSYYDNFLNFDEISDSKVDFEEDPDFQQFLEKQQDDFEMKISMPKQKKGMQIPALKLGGDNQLTGNQENIVIPKMEMPSLKMQSGENNVFLPMEKLKQHTMVEQQQKYKNYEDIMDDEEAQNDIRQTHRKQLKIDYFSEKCSEVEKDFLYLSGDVVAQNLILLEQTGITHIINAAGDICHNYFPEKFTYLTYHLKDSKKENIECVFYESIEFIQAAKEKGGKVLVHCQQGVSRSVSICIAYMIFKQKITYQQAEVIIKKCRGVANPNPGFSVQLIFFYKRLYLPFKDFPYNPRVFAVGSHEVEDPSRIVCRMMFEPFYQKEMQGLALDPRGVFIIQREDQLIIWIGKLCNENRLDRYLEAANEHILKLQKYENSSQVTSVQKESSEVEGFWAVFGFKEPPKEEHRYKICDFYDNLFIDPDEVYQVSSSRNRQQQEEQQEQIEQSMEKRKGLYIYPNNSECLTMMDFDDLNPEALLVLCLQTQAENIVYIWKGIVFQEVISPPFKLFTSLQAEKEEQFVDDAIENFFADPGSLDISVREQEYDKEDQSFIKYFI